MRKSSLSLLVLVVAYSCSSPDLKMKRDRLWGMIRSGKVISIMKATEEIRIDKDTSMIDALLYNANDPRVSDALSFKGKSVYQVKMEALKEVTGLKPPQEIDYLIDTTIVQFYRIHTHRE